MEAIDAKKKNIVIVGAGFGGITVALKLARNMGGLLSDYQIILIDRHHHQLYTPALYEIASIPNENITDVALKTSILIPIADIVAGKPITALTDEIVGLAADTKKVLLKKSGALPYEFLIIALGSETNYFNIPGLTEHSLPLKNFDDALRLRNTIEEKVKKDGHIKIVVGGAGSSGVELIAEFVNFVCAIKEKVLGGKQICNAEFLLVEGTPEILPGFDAWTIKKTKRRLARLGIRIKTSAAISAVEEREIIFKNGERESYDILCWTGGVRGPAIFSQFGFPLSQKGGLEIEETLHIKGADRSLFAIGDNASFINPKTGKPLVWNVPIAEAEGRVVAQNIIRTIRNEPLRRFVPLKKYPFILAVGKKYAIADLLIIRICGFWGWFLKQLVELRYLLFILPIKKAIRTWLRGEKYFMSND
ncbi:MAG: NAD(P)/FAD-dependent oxidoreductase [bacterium]|nr:NAD(P)/FAD-dependent oxidoreductase [bacterium]